MNLFSTIMLFAVRHGHVGGGGGGAGAFSITAMLWLMMFIILAYKGMTHAIWGLCLYIMTMYILPGGWWWGKGTLVDFTSRWNLFAALIFAAGVAAQSNIHKYRTDAAGDKVLKLLVLYTINATFVHFFMASNPSKSVEDLILVWKQLGLILLMYWAVATPSDLKKFFYVLVLCSFYIGFEVVVNSRGKFSHSRLEGIFVPGAAESNYLAGLLALALPLLGALVLVGTTRDKIIAVLCAPFILDTILRCNSRGAYLALIVGGIRMFVASKGRMRSFATLGAVLVVVAVLLQAKDPRIWERLSTIAPISEKVMAGADASAVKDEAAESRIEFWKAASHMILENPLGSGGEAAFKSPLGSRYIAHLNTTPFRAVHNGYLDIAAGWGIQGLLLYLSAIFIAWRSLRKAIEFNLDAGEPVKAFIGVAIEAALATQLVVCMFISSLDGEWFYWLMAMMLSYGRIYGPPAGTTAARIKRRVVVTGEMMNRALERDPFEDPVPQRGQRARATTP